MLNIWLNITRISPKKIMFLREVKGTLHVLVSAAKARVKSPNLGAESVAQNDSRLNFLDYYLEVEDQKMRRFKNQRGFFLGKNLRSVAHADSDGKKWLSFLQGVGLNESHVVLEYGCGSLRLGKTVIEYLNPGNYLGLDITSTFYEIGKKNYLGKKIFDEKKPCFGLIGSSYHVSLKKKFAFDFGYSTMVLMHVPPAELSNYFSNVIQLMHEESVFYFDFQPSLFVCKKNSLTWGFPFNLLKNEVKKLGGTLRHVEGNLLELRAIQR